MLESVCKPASGTEYKTTAGTKYNCKVDPNKPEYTFYVLTTVEVPEGAEEGATSVNLIMDSNIRTGGEAVKEETPTDEQKGIVAWLSKEDYTRKDIGGTEEDWGDYGNSNKGPITAIEYLQRVTSGWTNVNPQTISTFTDDKGNTHNMAKTYIANARMPYYSEVGNSNGTNEYLYEYLDVISWDGAGTQPTSNVSEVNGYWICTAYDSDLAWVVHSNGYIYSGWGTGIDDDNNHGIRPVINLSI